MPPPSIPQRLLRLALPIIGLNLLNVMALAVDTAMCGRLPDNELALTALGFATQTFFVLLVGAMGLTSAAVALVARAHGAQQGDRVVHIIHQVLWFTLGFGVSSGTAGVLLAPIALGWLGASDAAASLAMEYLTPMLMGSAFYYLNIVLAAMLRGVGNTRLPFNVAIGSNILNGLLNYGFILGGWGLPALGLGGAALGTVASQAAAVVVLVTLLRRGAVEGVFVPLRPAKLDVPLAGELWRVGWPAALDMMVLNIMLLSIVGMIGHIDEVAVAAHTVGIRIQSLAFVPGMSVSQAAAALVGQALGRGSPQEARAVLRAARVLCGAILTTLGIIFTLLGGPMLQYVFDLHPGTDAHEYAVQWIMVLGATLPIAGVWMAYAGLLHGSGDTFASLKINVASTLGIQIPVSALLGYGLGWGPVGVWLGLPAGEVLKLVLGHRAYRLGHWARVGSNVH